MLRRCKALEDKRKPFQVELDRLRSERNANAKAVGMAKGRGEDVAPLIAKGEQLTQDLVKAEEDLTAVQAELEQWQLGLPNLLHESVPEGKDETGNVEVRRWGEPRALGFKARDHIEIGEKLAGLDFEAAARISGARFVVMKGQVARLHRALAQFMLDLHTGEHGYTEVYVPYLVQKQALSGYGAVAEVCAGLVRGARRAAREGAGVLPDSHGRSAGDESRAGADRRGEGVAAEVCVPYAVFPLRGGGCG